MKVPSFVLLLFVFSSSGHVSTALAQQTKQPFTVADDIELWRLIPDLDGSNGRFSPDGNYFAVYSARGRLDMNRPEDSIRFYRIRDVKSFLDEGSDASQSPSPVWVIRLSSDKEGVIIHDWRWLPDSSGVAFLQRMAGGHQRLVLADIRRKVIEGLTSPRETVRQFDIRNRNHYVYTTLGMETGQVQVESQTPFVVGTGLQLYQLVLPDDPQVLSASRIDITRSGGSCRQPVSDQTSWGAHRSYRRSGAFARWSMSYEARCV